MPWKENRTMDLRVQLIQEYDEGESISALAEVYGVSRKTIYKWLVRHDAEGVAGSPTAAGRRINRRTE
jgi:putative transposase